LTVFRVEVFTVNKVLEALHASRIPQIRPCRPQ
jgi:hypothetical protein